MGVEIKVLGRDDLSLLGNVAPDVFDDPIDEERAAEFLGDARHHLVVAVEDGHYHLVEQQDRVAALREARRVLRTGGLVFAAGISRFASTLDGLVRRLIDDPVFAGIVERDLADGQHRNPTDHPSYFTTAYFHRPEELAAEFEEAGLRHHGTFAIESPAWLLPNFEERWRDVEHRARMLDAIRAIECEPSLVGASAHILAVGAKEA